MKPFHFYLFLFFAYWLQPQVLPAQDNRLAKHPFSQDSWYRADSTGKLYDFRLYYKPQANSFDSCYIRPYRPLEKKGQQTD